MKQEDVLACEGYAESGPFANVRRWLGVRRCRG